MKVTLIDHMGSDLTVVNAARVSMNKNKTSFDESDEKLINYLAKHKHWTPFGHPQVQLYIKAPIFVARQLGKHQVGFVWNEVSRRYVDYEPEFYEPTQWRCRAKNVKQGSDPNNTVEFDSSDINEKCKQVYNELLEKNVCPEMARMILPQSMYTEWYWTGSLYAFYNMCKLRLDPHAQEETRIVAQQIYEILNNLFPVSWKSLMNNSS